MKGGWMVMYVSDGTGTGVLIWIMIFKGDDGNPGGES